MPTQGGAVNWTINQFYVVEPMAAEAPAEIIPLNAPFEVKVEFDGNGGAWQALENPSSAFEVKFYAEGIGAGALELDLGTELGNLAPAGGPYVVTHAVAGIPQEGIYRLGCLIRISPPSSVVGFEENLLISVSDQ